jgi:hypothetical protein
MYLIKIFLIYTVFVFSINAKNIYLTTPTGENSYGYDFDDFKAKEKVFLTRDRWVELVLNKKLGEGSNTIVFRVKDPKDNWYYALRIPNQTQEREYVEATMLGYTELRERGVYVPLVKEYRPESYILLEEKEVIFDLGQYLDKHFYVNEAENLEALLRFAREVAPFSQIGDAHEENIVFSEKENRWILLDWTFGHELAEDSSSLTIFDGDEGILSTGEWSDSSYDHPVIDKLREEIYQERLRIEKQDKLDIKRVVRELHQVDTFKKLTQIYLKSGQRHLGDYFLYLKHDFLKHRLPRIRKSDYSIKDILIIKKQLNINGYKEFEKYLFPLISVVQNMNDLYYFLSEERIYNTGASNQKKYKKLLKDKVSNLIDATTFIEGDKTFEKKVALENILNHKFDEHLHKESLIGKAFEGGNCSINSKKILLN